MIINTATYNLLMDTIGKDKHVKFIYLKFIVENGKVSVDLIAFKSKNDYEDFLENGLYICIFDREIVANNQKYFLRNLNEIVENINNINPFTKVKIIKLLEKKFKSYKSFTEYKSAIIDYIYLIRKATLDANKSIENIRKKLSKLADFSLNKNDIKLIESFKDNLLREFTEKLNIKDPVVDGQVKQIDKIIEKNKRQKEYLESEEFIKKCDNYRLELVQKNYENFLRKERLSELYIFFFDSSGEIKFKNEDMFQAEKNNILEQAYEVLFKKYEKSFLKDRKVDLREPTNIYTRLEREMNAINLYRLDFVLGMNPKIQTVFQQLYSLVGKNLLNNLQIEFPEKILEDEYELWNDYFVQPVLFENIQIEEKRIKGFEKLLSIGIDGENWEEKAKELDIYIPNYLEESEISTEDYQSMKERSLSSYINVEAQIESFLICLSKHFKTIEEQENIDIQPDVFDKDFLLNDDVATLESKEDLLWQFGIELEEIEYLNDDITILESKEELLWRFGRELGKIKEKKSLDTHLNCSCKISYPYDYSIVTCELFFDNEGDYEKSELIDIAQNVECAVIIDKLISYKDLDITRVLYFEGVLEEKYLLEVVEEFGEELLAYCILNNITDKIIEIVSLIKYIDFPLLEELHNIKDEEIKIALLNSYVADNYIDYFYDSLSDIRNAEIQKLLKEFSD